MPVFVQGFPLNIKEKKKICKSRERAQWFLWHGRNAVCKAALPSLSPTNYWVSRWSFFKQRANIYLLPTSSHLATDLHKKYSCFGDLLIFKSSKWPELAILPGLQDCFQDSFWRQMLNLYFDSPKQFLEQHIQIPCSQVVCTRGMEKGCRLYELKGPRETEELWSKKTTSTLCFKHTPHVEDWPSSEKSQDGDLLSFVTILVQSKGKP